MNRTAVELTGESVVEAVEDLSPESRIALAKFIAFLRQQEAEEEERLIMSDPELAAPIRKANEKLRQGKFEEFETLREAFPDDV